MDMAFVEVCLRMLLVFVLSWTIFHVTNRKKKKATKLADVATEERKEGGPDVIIVGAGVGGSALAYALAKDGRRVHVIERDMREPVRMMGEFMQPGGRLMLSKLGLQETAPKGLVSSQVLNSLYHFISNVRLEEGTVRSLIEEKGVVKGVTYKNSSGEETTSFAPLTVAEVTAYEIGYISRNCRLEQPDKLHLIMAKPSFAMMYQISSTDVRCNFELLSKNLPSVSNGEMASFVKNSIAPSGLVKLSLCVYVAAKRMPATLSRKKGVIVLGDAFNMRHPVIASGMMVLLSDILILSRLLKPLGNLGDENKVSEVMKSFYVLRKPMSATVNTLGNSFWQVLIASTDEAREAMRQGCFDYLSSGGFRTSGLMALIGGMNPRPLSLFYHLFVISLSSIGQLLSPFPTPLRVWHSLRLLDLSLKMLVPHLKAEGIGQMLSPTNAAAYRKSYMTATVV
ncbi:hypothetical protein Bca4012_079352 [Brassica carinata]